MMERTVEEMMGRKVTLDEHDDMRRIFDEAEAEARRGGKSRNKAKAKAARKSRKKNRR